MKKKNFQDLFVRNSMDIPFLIILLVLLTVGLVMMLSASYFNAFYQTDDGDSLYYFKKQILYTGISLIFLFVVSKVNYKYFRGIGALAMIASYGLLFIVLLLPASSGDVKRWINLGFIQFQPSEVAKISLIIFLAHLLDRNVKKVKSTKMSNSRLAITLFEISGKRIKMTEATMTLIWYFILVCSVAGLVFLESHLSGTILILGIGVIMLWLGECRARWFVIAAVGGIVLITLFIVIIEAKDFTDIPFLKDYQAERIRSWLDKDFDPQGARWQTNQSLYAIGSGGFLGAGLGNSKEKYLYVSEPQNDFIFAIVCEELGFVGAVLILLLYAALILRGAYIGLRAKERFGSLLAFGMVSQLALQVILNVGVVSDLLPNTGIGLPFFSYGGTSMMFCLVEMGVVLSVSRQANLPKVYSFGRKRKEVK